MKKIIALVLVLCLGLCVFAGCNEKKEPITAEQAIIAIAKDLNISTSKIANAHVHVDSGSVPAYNIYFSVDGVYYEYVVAAADGSIISGHTVEEGHSH